MMRLHHAKGRCQRCSQSWEANNAMGLAAQHERKTGHVVEVTMVYRTDNQPLARTAVLGLPFDRPTGTR